MNGVAGDIEMEVRRNPQGRQPNYEFKDGVKEQRPKVLDQHYDQFNEESPNGKADGHSNINLLNNSDFERDVRVGFIRKVLGIVLLQIIVTLGIAVYSSQDAEFGALCRHWGTLTFAIIMMLTTMTVLLCCDLTRVVPINYFFLLFFTLSESLIVANMTSYYEPESVIAAIIVFAVTTLCLWVISLCIKTMSQFWPAMLCSIFISLIL